MKNSHLISTLISLLLLTAGLVVGEQFTLYKEDEYIHAMASRATQQMTIGEAWQRSAFQQPDLLVIYGASEQLSQPGPYQSLHFFQNYPTGFDTVEFTRQGMDSLNLAQDMAAVGPFLRGKKVVVSFTPTEFIHSGPSRDSYYGNFSQIHADEFAFSPQLSWNLKQTAAWRMLQYPQTLVKDPLLDFALQRLVSGTLLDRLLYYACWPLGLLQVEVLRLQDHWENLMVILNTPRLNPVVQRKPAVIYWDALAARARVIYKPQCNNNPYGIQNQNWALVDSPVIAAGTYQWSEQTFIRRIETSDQWLDLQIELQTLKELGADPLVMSRPFSGVVWADQGLTPVVRGFYHTRLESLVKSYGFALADFRDFDTDIYFNTDMDSHTSPEGWIHVDQALDAYFHGNLQ